MRSTGSSSSTRSSRASLRSPSSRPRSSARRGGSSRRSGPSCSRFTSPFAPSFTASRSARGSASTLRRPERRSPFFRNFCRLSAGWAFRSGRRRSTSRFSMSDLLRAEKILPVRPSGSRRSFRASRITTRRRSGPGSGVTRGRSRRMLSRGQKLCRTSACTSTSRAFRWRPCAKNRTARLRSPSRIFGSCPGFRVPGSGRRAAACAFAASRSSTGSG